MLRPTPDISIMLLTFFLGDQILYVYNSVYPTYLSLKLSRRLQLGPSLISQVASVIIRRFIIHAVWCRWTFTHDWCIMLRVMYLGPSSIPILDDIKILCSCCGCKALHRLVSPEISYKSDNWTKKVECSSHLNRHVCLIFAANTNLTYYTGIFMSW